MKELKKVKIKDLPKDMEVEMPCGVTEDYIRQLKEALIRQAITETGTLAKVEVLETTENKVKVRISEV